MKYSHTINKNGTFINISVLKKKYILIIDNYLINENKHKKTVDIKEELNDITVII